MPGVGPIPFCFPRLGDDARYVARLARRSGPRRHTRGSLAHCGSVSLPYPKLQLATRATYFERAGTSSVVHDAPRVIRRLRPPLGAFGAAGATGGPPFPSLPSFPSFPPHAPSH
jgi:hypothetical protein